MEISKHESEVKKATESLRALESSLDNVVSGYQELQNRAASTIAVGNEIKFYNSQALGSVATLEKTMSALPRLNQLGK